MLPLHESAAERRARYLLAAATAQEAADRESNERVRAEYLKLAGAWKALADSAGAPTDQP